MYFLLLSYGKLSRKPSLFKSFTGLSVKQFDDIFKIIESKYPKHEIKRLSYKRNRECSIDAGRHFKLLVKDRIIMVVVYYRLYITYTLMEFLFGLDQSNVCRDIQNIERLIRRCLPIPQKLYKVTKRLKTKEEVEKYFPGFMAFTDCTEQPTHSNTSKEREEKKTILFRQEKETHAQSRICIQLTKKDC
jgi:hypothetical protein